MKVGSCSQFFPEVQLSKSLHPEGDRERRDSRWCSCGLESRTRASRIFQCRSTIRAYIGQGLRADLERLDAAPNLAVLIETLRRHRVDEKVIAVVMQGAETASPRTKAARQSTKARRDSHW